MTLGDYLDHEADLIISMRLLIEGITAIFDCDGRLLFKPAMYNDEPKAAAAFDALAVALRDLRSHVLRLQEGHMQAVVEHLKEQFYSRNKITVV